MKGMTTTAGEDHQDPYLSLHELQLFPAKKRRLRDGGHNYSPTYVGQGRFKRAFIKGLFLVFIYTFIYLVRLLQAVILYHLL